MAGIGFELRRYLDQGTYTGLLKAYGVAALVGSGPWVISMVGTLMIGLLSARRVVHPPDLTAFLASITYVTALSLLFTGPLQLSFTRFVADRLFEERRDLVFPNVMGALVLVAASAGLLGTLLAATLLQGSLAYRALMVAAFVILCGIWLLAVFLASLKEYRIVLALFAAGYLVAVGAAVGLARHGATAMLLGFVLGHAILLFGLLTVVLRAYPSGELLGFRFLRRERALIMLAATGLMYHLAVWVDKLLFWANPVTSTAVAGPIRISLVYDIPIFLAYLTIIPGMSVFLLRIETDFAERYQALFATIRNGGTLNAIEKRRDAMVAAVRVGINDILRIQGLTVAVLLWTGPALFRSLGIPAVYLHTFYADIVGVAAQVLLLAVLTVLFYLDYRAPALGLCMLFAAGNAVLTTVSFTLGPVFYGFGFAVAAVLACFVGLLVLSRRLDRLECDLFMR